MKQRADTGEKAVSFPFFSWDFWACWRTDLPSLLVIQAVKPLEKVVLWEIAVGFVYFKGLSKIRGNSKLLPKILQQAYVLLLSSQVKLYSEPLGKIFT